MSEIVELRDADKIKEAGEQSTFSFFSVIIISLFLFLLGVLAGVYFSDFLKEMLKFFPLWQ